MLQETTKPCYSLPARTVSDIAICKTARNLIHKGSLRTKFTQTHPGMSLFLAAKKLYNCTIADGRPIYILIVSVPQEEVAQVLLLCFRK